MIARCVVQVREVPPAEKVSIWMENARQIAVAGYRKAVENGLEVCDSESDSENSDHGEMLSYAEMYTADMLGPDGKPKNGGPQRLSAVQVTALRAASKGPTGCNPSQTTARLPTPLNSDEDSDELAEDQKRRLATAKRMSGMAGGLVTVAGSRATDMRVTRSHPSHT
jgi:hypothetical protein